MNYTALLISPTFFEFLLEIDLVIAEKTRLGGCFFCGGILHVANWLRAGYGIPEGCRNEVLVRHSFTCGSCEKRCTPNSLRFMYYRWYSTSVELVVSAFNPEGSKESQRKLMKAVNISEGTLTIFRKWWKEKFSGSIFEKRSPLAIASTPGRSASSLILKSFKKFGTSAKAILESAASFLSSYRSDRLWAVFKTRISGFGGAPVYAYSPFFMG